MIKKLKKPFIFIFVIYIIYKFIPVPEYNFGKNYSTVVRDSSGAILRVYLNKNDQWYFRPTTGKVTEKLKKSILMFEDKYYYYHPGVNPISIIRAAKDNILNGRIVSGASTIPMQVIRIWGKKRRTFFNKLLEIFQALKLNIVYSKEKILNMYISNAPYGGNIIGVGAASLKYFGKLPEDLTWNEASILAVLPNSPGKISLTINRTKLVVKKNRLLRTLYRNGDLNKDILDMSLREPVPKKLKTFPIIAPHFSRFLKRKYWKSGIFIDTNIVKKIQLNVKKILQQNMNYLRSLGIMNGAVVVAQTGNGKVRAYCGSQNFFDNYSSGQVDGVMAGRSSGSILKPFLYALAIDEGLIIGRTLIKDIPSYFGSYSPTNSGGGFSGIVTAKDALVRSLNVPAVRLLSLYGLQKFYLFLKSAGMTSLFRSPQSYGLTLILGGAETKLFDLVMLYRGLGDNGKFKSLKIIRDKNRNLTDRESELISPGASYLVLNMLKELRRPGAEYYWEQYQNLKPVAWKTGTSYGQRDAWSVGVNPSWTVGVWVGNFNGEGNSSLSGSSCAAPIMFDIFNYLPDKSKRKWFVATKGSLKKIKVCADTGFLAGPECEKTILVEAPIHSKPLKICPYHRGIYTTMDGRNRVCSLCWEEGKYKKESILLFPPDVSQFLREKGNILPILPPHKKGCPSVEEIDPLKIIYPVQNAKILIPRDFRGIVQAVTLKVANSVKDRIVYWYIDRRYSGKTVNVHKMAFQLIPGWHVLSVIDAEGNRASRRFHISLFKKK